MAEDRSLVDPSRRAPTPSYDVVPSDPANMNAQALRIESQPGTGFERGVVLGRDSLYPSRNEPRPMLVDLREVTPDKLATWDLIAFPGAAESDTRGADTWRPSADELSAPPVIAFPRLLAEEHNPPVATAANCRMNAEAGSFKNAASSDPLGTLLRCLVVCDLADSTALVERLGDRAAADLIRRHDQLARAAVRSNGGREIDKADGFLLLFDRPAQATAFALRYQRQVRALAEETGHALSARVGIHVGDVVVWDNAPGDIERGAKPMEVEGLAKPIAARLMSLALPGQILVSGVAYSLAQRSEREPDALNVRWLSHGRYHLKGIPELVAVYEIGEPGVAPLRAPPDSAKGGRPMLSWRRSVAMGSVALLAAVGSAAYLYVRSEPALPFAERDWVVLGDLVNVNADKTLDAPLGTAFRIGMEQSRFINVVSQVETHQALVRMQRNETTRIDREVGSEIALREQARALIIPSIAQFGRKLRLSAELIDPLGARTVAIQTADVDDPNDALPAIDRLLSGTRASLGESLKRIRSTSQPLDRVATPNLEALKTLSRALEVARNGDFEQSGKLLVYATELDPSFATAYARLGSMLYSQERYAEARVALEKALAIEGRLTDRERLFVRGILAGYSDPRSALDVWRMYQSLYPDDGHGQHNVGNVCYMQLHDYAAAEAALLQAAATRIPMRNYTLHTLGHVLLSEEKYDESEVQFRAAEAAAPAPDLFGMSDALVAKGKFDDAVRYLDETSRQPADVEVDRVMRRATLLAAQGQIDAAASAVAEGLPDTARLPSPNARWRAQAAIVALRAAQGDEKVARDLAGRHLAELSSNPARPDGNLQVMEELLYAAGWAARLGMVEEVRDAIAFAEKYGALDRFPVRAQLAALARAELDLHAGHADRVAERFQSVKSGNDLWEFHEIRARALDVLGDTDGQLIELRWLVAHRGLALGQWTDQLLGQQARALAVHEAESGLATDRRRAEGTRSRG